MEPQTSSALSNGTVIAALCTSLASIAVSVVAYFNAQKNNKTTAQAAIELEKLRFNQEQTRKLLDGKKEERKELFSALNGLIKNMQTVKDLLIRIIGCLPKSFSWQSAVAQMDTSKEAYVAHFEEVCALLQGDNYKYSHKAKNLIMNLPFLLASFAEKVEGDFIELGPEEQHELRSLKEELNDAQNFLRDSKLHQIDLW